MNTMHLTRVVCQFAALLLAAVTFGCGPKQSSGQQQLSAGAPAPATADAPAAPTAKSGTISIKGSDTMVHLVTTWADAFMKAHPDAKLSVTGGGSGTGISALLNGTTDICSASRDLNEEEKKDAAAKGLVLIEKTVARDALSIVVNTKNPVNELTLEQLEKIYTGAVKKWTEFGGADEPIVVTSRESTSGTYMFFQEHVLHKKDYTQDALLLAATSAIVQSVADSSGAIGYVGLGYAREAGDKVKTISVKATQDAPAVAPSVESVLNGQYSISRPLFLIVSKEPAGVVKDFLDFCLSSDGQAIVDSTGYVKVN